MPRVQLTDSEARLVDRRRHRQGLVRKGLLMAKKVVEDETHDAGHPDVQEVKLAIVTALETLIKEYQ